MLTSYFLSICLAWYIDISAVWISKIAVYSVVNTNFSNIFYKEKSGYILMSDAAFPIWNFLDDQLQRLIMDRK